jgi:hypothetical protein
LALFGFAPIWPWYPAIGAGFALIGLLVASRRRDRARDAVLDAARLRVEAGDISAREAQRRAVGLMGF